LGELGGRGSFWFVSQKVLWTTGTESATRQLKTQQHDTATVQTVVRSDMEGFLVKIRVGGKGKQEERYFILSSEEKEINFYQQDTKG
jgi:hypothetical protein